MAVFDSVKNGVACLCDPLKQFFGSSSKNATWQSCRQSGASEVSLGVLVAIAPPAAIAFRQLQRNHRLRLGGKVRCTFYRRRGLGGLGLAMVLDGEQKTNMRSGMETDEKVALIAWRLN